MRRWYTRQRPALSSREKTKADREAAGLRRSQNKVKHQHMKQMKGCPEQQNRPSRGPQIRGDPEVFFIDLDRMMSKGEETFGSGT